MNASVPAGRFALWGRLVVLAAAGYAGAVPFLAALVERLPRRPALPVGALVALQAVLR